VLVRRAGSPLDFPAPSTVRDWKLAGGRAPAVWSGRGNTQPQPTATAPAPVKAAFRLFPHRRGDPARHLGWQLRRRRAPPAPLLGLAGNGKPFHLPLVAATKLATINQGKVLSAVHTTVPSVLAEPDALSVM